MAEEQWNDLKKAVTEFWSSFLSASKDNHLILFCEGYTDEQIEIDESLREEFLNSFEEVSWILTDDPEDKKVSSSLKDAVANFRNSFLNAPDDNHLSLFFNNYIDERFDENFRDRFLTSLRASTAEGRWALTTDPGYEVPKKLMEDVYYWKKQKLMKKRSKKAKAAAKAAAQAAAEAAAQAAAEAAAEAAAQAAMKQNLQKKIEYAAEIKKSFRAAQDIKAKQNKEKIEEARYEAQLINLENQAKGTTVDGVHIYGSRRSR